MSDKRLKDKDWRINNLYKIVDKNSEIVKFKPNAAQEHFRNNLHTRNIVLKSRQLGFTTFEAIDGLDDTLFNSNFNSLFVAHVKEEATKIFDNKIEYAWKNFNPELKGLWSVDKNNVKELKFDFGDNSISSISVATSGRSGTYNRVHVSEFAKMQAAYPKKAIELIRGTIPAVPLDGRVDIESTAEGEFGYFHDMFWEAWDRTRKPLLTEYKAHFYNWTWDKEEMSKIGDVIPTSEMDQAEKFTEIQRVNELTDIEITYYYLKWLSLAKDWQSLKQEYPITPEEAFISSGIKFIDAEALDYFDIFEGKQEGELTIFNEYNPLHLYVIGADVAEGLGLDSSTAVVLDITTSEVVATYKDNNVEADVFADVLAGIGRRYGSCVIAVERNNHGHTTLAKLKSVYPIDQIYSEVRVDKNTNVETDKLGWHTNAASKPRMLLAIKTAILEMLIQVHSQALAREIKTYDKSDMGVVNRKNDETTKHWDLFIALCIAWQARLSATPQMARQEQQAQRYYSRRARGSARIDNAR